MVDTIVLIFSGISIAGYLALLLWCVYLLIIDLSNGGKAKPRTSLVFSNIALYFLHAGLSGALCIDGMGFFTRSDGKQIQHARWLVYTVSAVLLALQIAKVLRHTTLWKRTAAILLASTVFAGWLISREATSGGRALLFGLGFVPFIGAFLIVVLCRNVDASFWFALLIIQILATWIVYPIAFALGHAMYRVISYNTETVIYAITDWFAKMLFTVYLTYTIGEKRYPRKTAPENAGLLSDFPE